MKTLRNDGGLKVICFEGGALSVNSYTVHDMDAGECLLIDPGFYSEEIADYIAGNCRGNAKILNTHGHSDHISANDKFNYPVMIHEKDQPYLGDPLKNMSFFSGLPVGDVTPYRLLADGDEVRVGRYVLDVIHTPGHTPGGISLLCEGIVFTGDTLFCDGIGRTDLPGGDYDEIKRSIKDKLFSLPDESRVLPGHGPETTIGHEKQYNPFLDE